MKVSISVDIIENMLRLHHRRGETQKCIFALLLGVIDGYNNYTIKECLYRFIYYNENYQEGSKDNAAKVFYLISKFFNFLVFSSFGRRSQASHYQV